MIQVAKGVWELHQMGYMRDMELQGFINVSDNNAIHISKQDR